jgi:UDP-2,3-diacylglucosamine hydrolase
VQATLFISDLHLSSARPAINRIFFDFLRDQAAQAEALYVLGDLFEYWTGDDDDDPFNATVLKALRELTDRGTALHVMHGNRDFLLADQFAAITGAIMLPDTTLLSLHGQPTLLMHGDTLCTDDLRYQQFRAEVRTRQWRENFLAQPLATRRHIVAGLRDDSTRDKQLKSEAIMDVTVSAVESELRKHGYPRLIHGHTHRPARHVHVVDGHRCERWVLADWYDRAAYLQCSPSACENINL